MTPSRTRTSARRASAPVPSTTVPPRIRMSGIDALLVRSFSSAVSAAIVANLAAGRPPGRGDVDLAIGGAG
jgi:hypothetical protein